MFFVHGLDDFTPLLCVIAILILLSWWLFRGLKNLPRGPWGWPLIGYFPNLVLALYRSGQHPHELFTDLAGKYGKVFCMNLAGKLIVVLNGYDCIKEGFQNPHLIDRPNSPILEKLGLSGGLGQASGEAWKQQKRFTLTTLRSFGVGKMSFEESISTEAEKLSREITLLKENPFDTRYLLTNATANIICSFVFGQRFEYSDVNFKHLLDLMDENIKLLGAGAIQLFFPISRYLQPSTDRLFQTNITNLVKIITDIIEKHSASHNSESPRDYIDVYLSEIELSQKLDRDSHVNRKNLAYSVYSLLVAGTETAASTLCWAVLYMIAYPKIQDRVQKEMDSVVGRNRLPKLDDKDQLPFTSATLLEIQRIVSVAPLGVMHSNCEDVTLEGYTIPKGSLVISNLWAVHHDSNLWQNPHEFNPERFLDKDASVLKQREELIPFSAGRRTCIGENLAKMEIFIFFSHLLHQFTFKKPHDSPPLSLKREVGVITPPCSFLTQVIKRD